MFDVVRSFIHSDSTSSVSYVIKSYIGSCGIVQVHDQHNHGQLILAQLKASKDRGFVVDVSRPNEFRSSDINISRQMEWFRFQFYFQCG